MELTLDTPVRFIPRVGPAMASKLETLGLLTVRDILFHIPFRYNDFSLTSPIARVQPGETVTVKGVVEKFNAFASKSGKRIQEAKVRDDSGILSVIWFNQPFLRSVIKPGMTIHMSGPISWFGTKLVMNAPEYELFEGVGDSHSLHTGRIVPVYSATEGLSPKWIRARVAFLLETVLSGLTEYMPEKILHSYELMGIAQAIQTIHFPHNMEEAEKAKRRLAFDELLTLQLRAHLQKHERETKEKAPSMKLNNTDWQTFLKNLPFELTHDQTKAIAEIQSDLERSFPMNRLLIGDVGSGKTAVAASAIYCAYKNGYQSALMAPTQILAHQHFETINTLLAPLGCKVGLFTSEGADYKETFDVLVGTHSLISKQTTFKKLGLVVIDEQHRFGVSQREELIKKSTTQKQPHVLTMTATPIPRTVAKTMMGHMDLSTLFEMPKGRLPIKTWVVPNNKRENAYVWITTQLKQTHAQAFVICPLIDESETLTSVRAVKKEYETLKPKFPHLNLGLLHGQMKPKEKTDTLKAFADKTYDILVATPVVEVGIDIPNATIMIIEASERFGLSQLHQLRGRIGRGKLASYCLLFTEEENEKTLNRLKILEHESSGPKLAEADLELRGAGDILGTRQHGIPALRVASFSDVTTISETHEALSDLVKHDSDLKTFPLLREEAKKGTIEATVD
jgi:ATP-dependent DNA helicase RecG